METLQQKIQQFGTVPSEGVLKVDSFLNHIIDPHLMMEIGKEIAERFADYSVDKILTLEASGIAPALGAALALDVPLLFAKKNKPSTLLEGYSAAVHSFTKKQDYTIFVSEEYLSKDENILIIDDFLAMGSAILAMKSIITQAHANCVGAGIVIEKSFQPGRELLNEKGIHVESLVRLKKVCPIKGIEFL